MKEDATQRSTSKPSCAEERRYLYSTAAVEGRISADRKWNTKPRAFKVRYIVDAIVRQRLGMARVIKSRSKPVNLHNKALKGAIGNDYREILQLLMDAGLVGTDGKWRVGEKATGYYLTKRGWRGGIVPVEMDAGQAGRWTQARARLKRESDKKRKAEGVPLDYLRFHLGRLTWPDGAVEEHFERLPKVERWQDAAKVEAHQYAVGLVRSRDWTFHRCAAERLHYALTNVPGALRRRLEYDGEALVQIDVSSCQPFLAADLYRDAENSPRAKFISVEAERRRYLADVIGGAFYERIGKAARFEGERSDLKRAILAEVFFGSYEQADGSEIMRVFSCLYPLLADEIMASKIVLRPWKGDRDLALRLQGAEARIVIDGALARVARELPGVPAFPLHDCLMTLERHVEAVRRIMAEEFQAAMGEVPSFKVEATQKMG